MKGWIIAACLIGLLVWIGIASDNSQKNFIKQHHCVLVSTSDGTIAPGYAYTNKGGGFTTVYIPGKNGYKCDDGVIHYYDN